MNGTDENGLALLNYVQEAFGNVLCPHRNITRALKLRLPSQNLPLGEKL